MNIDRLKHLAHILDKAHEQKLVDHFYLGHWYDGMDYTDPGSTNNFTGKHCGTSACALGLACLDPEFKAQGLHLDYEWDPSYEDNYSYGAGAEFFGISQEDSYYLFDPDQYEGLHAIRITPAMVAERVRELINGHV